jgi:YD repeat-containing protein
MDKKTTEENLDGKILKTEEEYKYENSGHAQLTSQITTNSNGQKIEAKYYYPDDLLGEPFMQDLKSANRISSPVVTEQYKEGVLISKSKTAYAKDGTTGNLLLPKDLYQAKFPNNFTDIPNIGALEKKVTYDKYDEKGNVLQYTPEKSTPVSIVWGYNKTYPIAKIENTLYSSIPLETIANLQNLSNADFDNCLGADCKEQLLRNALNTFRNSLENAFITTYTYNPLVGVTSITDPKGISTYYEYDAANRLKFIKDKDLNVLQKYCYNYKGQQTDCGDNTSTTVIPYKSIARSGSFTKNNCAPGGTGSAVSYSQPQGAYVSDISQDDADNQGLALFNANGQANANSNGTCTFSSIARSGTFTKNNCAPGGSGSNVDYSQAAGAVTSTVSQADADAQGLAVFNANGQNNANANGYCTFYSAARSGSFTKNDCAAGGSGSVVGYSLNAGAFSSTISQADADNQALNYFNAQGQANANANGYCTFYSTARSGSFTKNDCAAGGTGSVVGYSLQAGAFSSIVSQADADNQALNYFNAQGQYNANVNGICTFSSTARNGSFAKNNCAPGGSGSNVNYIQAAGAVTSAVSQADADAQGLAVFNANGQNNANANGYCTFYSAARSGSFTKNDCAAGGTGSVVGYNLQSGAFSSTVSQADADNQALNYFNAQGQANANANGYCTFYSAARSGSFTKNDCSSGGNPSSTAYSLNAGAFTSTVSQADADNQALNYFNTQGQANANASGYCIYYNSYKSGSFIKNNCVSGGVGSTVLYEIWGGTYSSTSSQAAADALAQNAVNANGQAYANANGYCTFYSQQIMEKIYKNDYCPPGTTYPYVYYYVPYAKYYSTISQNDADGKAWAEVAANGQAYANATGTCLNPGELEE